MFWIFLFILLFTFGVFRFLLFRSNQRKFWTKRNFDYVPSILDMRQANEEHGYFNAVSSLFDFIDWDNRFYKLLKRKNVPCAGFPELGTPALFIRDLDLIKQIFVKNFDHFLDRRDFQFQFKGSDQLALKMLPTLQGEEWRALRMKMTTPFTTGKIRRMFDIMDRSGQGFVNYLDDQIKKSPLVDIADASGKFLLDVIAGSAFGLDSGVFGQNQNTISEFHEMASRYQVKLSMGTVLNFLAILIAPRISEYFGLSVTDKQADKFFSSVILDTIKQRKQSAQIRDDFLQLMMDAQNQSENLEKKSLTDRDICAQSILFFIAGFDTTQALLMFAAYELALNPEVQETLAKEVDEMLRSNGGKFSYDAINGLDYMDKFISETLRLHTPSFRLERKCTADHPIEGTPMVIPKGTVLILPIFAIHRDEDIYPNPNKFDPERFSKEAKSTRHPYAFMPFGHGPRSCIGMRFALMESKLAIAQLVHNYTIHPCKQTPIPMTYLNSPSLKPRAKIIVQLTKRN